MPSRCSGNVAAALPTWPKATWDWMESRFMEAANSEAPWGGQRAHLRIGGGQIRSRALLTIAAAAGEFFHPTAQDRAVRARPTRFSACDGNAAGAFATATGRSGPLDSRHFAVVQANDINLARSP